MDRDYVTINRDIWDAEAAHWVAMGAQRWALEAPIWGNWGAAEAALNLLPADLAGKDAIELGCGTGYVSGWMARRGAWRLLRPGGRLVFLGNHPLVLVCSPLNGAPCDATLHRPYRDMWGADWTQVEFDPTGVCFNLTMSGWMDLFRAIGFRVTNYQEIYIPDHETETSASVPAEWGKKYPVEQVWHLEKPA